MKSKRVQLSKVAAVNTDKCVNCHACITACPVKYCNDGSGDHLQINENMCIGCGSCIKACTHDARYEIDDFETFALELGRHILVEQRNVAMQKRFSQKVADGFNVEKVALQPEENVPVIRKFSDVLEDYWKPGLYDRTYRNLSFLNTVKMPSISEQQVIFHSMKKFNDEDFYNCSSCGYGSCQEMSIAIFNKLNKKENCHYYKNRILLEMSENVSNTFSQFERNTSAISDMHSTMQHLCEEFDKIDDSIDNMH